MNEKWHFRIWRAVMLWLVVWFSYITVSAIIHDDFPWLLILPIGWIATLFYLDPETIQWLLGCLFLHAMIVNAFPWDSIIIVVYICLSVIPLEMRVRYVLRKESKCDSESQSDEYGTNKSIEDYP